jgi:glycosyltransferase involved in cell wall biosynthesis
MIGTAFDTKGGISSVVKTYRDAGLFEHENVRYVATHCDGPTLKKMFVFACAMLRLFLALCRRSEDILHAHVSADGSFWRKSCVLLLASTLGVRTILHLHAGRFPRFYASLPFVLQKVVRLVFARVDIVVVLSRAWGEWVTDTFSAPVEIISNPVVIPREAPVRAMQSVSVVALGRLGRNKGTFDLIHATQILKARHPDVELLLAGDGELSVAEKLANDLGLAKNVKILGWVDESARASLLESASVFVLPSYSEGLPMSMLEAMATGLPVVVTPVGGITDVVRDGVEGFIVAPGDLQNLADRIDALLSDSDLRSRMGDAGRLRVSNLYDAESTVGAVRSLYARLRKQ